jgi:hypothetical protein
MENKYHFALTRWDGCTEFKSIAAPTYAAALALAYRDDRIVGTNCKGITLWGGLTIPQPYNPGEYDINL